MPFFNEINKQVAFGKWQKGGGSTSARCDGRVVGIAQVPSLFPFFTFFHFFLLLNLSPDCWKQHSPELALPLLITKTQTGDNVIAVTSLGTMYAYTGASDLGSGPEELEGHQSKRFRRDSVSEH